VPPDYNAWLVFRGLVDFVLLNDFASYLLFALAFAERPPMLTWLDGLRYAAGLGLCVFNWFVKIDALRVVKDYAWCTLARAFTSTPRLTREHWAPQTGATFSFWWTAR
jgi:hypothetical protein